MSRSVKTIHQEAADWVIALQPDGGTEAQAREFRSWLQRSPLHVRAYLGAETVWMGLQQVDAGRKIDVEALLREPANVLRLQPPLTREPATDSPVFPAESPEIASSSSFGRRFAVAAAILALIALPVAWHWSTGPTQEMATATGEQRTVMLDDGSVVELNALSTVRVDFTNTVRRVQVIDGEAFFNIAKDPERPFVVDVDTVEVKAVGTQFNVYRRRESTTVTVSEGQVQLRLVADGGNGPLDTRAIDLAVGQQAVVARGSATVIEGESRVQQAMAWRNQQLICIGEPLGNVVEEINRYNNRKLIVGDAALAAQKVSGVFNVHDPELIVRFLERSSGVTVEVTSAGEWLLSRRAGAGPVIGPAQ